MLFLEGWHSGTSVQLFFLKSTEVWIAALHIGIVIHVAVTHKFVAAALA